MQLATITLKLDNTSRYNNLMYNVPRVIIRIRYIRQVSYSGLPTHSARYFSAKEKSFSQLLYHFQFEFFAAQQAKQYRGMLRWIAPLFTLHSKQHEQILWWNSRHCGVFREQAEVGSSSDGWDRGIRKNAVPLRPLPDHFLVQKCRYLTGGYFLSKLFVFSAMFVCTFCPSTAS